MKPFELFCFKHSKYFEALLFFLVACNKKFQRGNAQPYANAANANVNKARWTRDSQVCTRLVDSLFCITCSRSCFFCPWILFSVSRVHSKTICILCSALRYVTLVLPYFTLWYIDLRFFLLLGQSRTALLGCREASRSQ